MKYYIIPKKDFEIEVDEKSKEDAIMSFTTNMETDMNIYFQVVTEDEYVALKESESDAAAHRRFVIKFMENELISHFDIPENEAKEVAEDAYEIYCCGNGQTEYECIEEAYDVWLKNSNYKEG